MWPKNTTNTWRKRVRVAPQKKNAHDIKIDCVSELILELEFYVFKVVNLWSFGGREGAHPYSCGKDAVGSIALDPLLEGPEAYSNWRNR